MIAMVIEGAKQIAQYGRIIVGYRLKETSFSHPIFLNTTSNNPEAQLYMRPNPQINESFSTSEFRICVTEDGDWIESCRGSICVDYESIVNEVSGKRDNTKMSEHYRQTYERAVRICDKPVDSQRMYQHFEEIGLNYGPAFRRLENLAWDGASTAIGQISTYQPEKSDNSSSIEPHIVHPATLDAAAQLTWLALTKGATAVIPSAVPTRIREMWISASGLGYPEPTVLRASSVSCFKGSRGTESSMYAVDPDGNLRISISLIETTALSSRSDVMVQLSDPRNLCYSMDWKPEPSFLTSQQVLALCGANQPNLADEPIQFYQDLELLNFSYISGALKDIESKPLEMMKPHMKSYIRWMKQKVVSYQVEKLWAGNRDWISLSENPEAMSFLAQKLEHTNKEGKLFVTVGRSLSSILRGTLDPLEILFTESLAEDHYQETCDKILSCRKIYNYLDILAHKNPALRIIEIGAGTGSMTGHVISPILSHQETENGTPRFSKYDYTDISGSFFGRAREKFAGIPNMEFKTLNIETDPVSQGFSPESYDLVVACNVLHATPDLCITLKNTRKLLKPGGKLLLLEITELERLRCNFAYGTLPGWWCSKEDYREQGPCVPEAQWDHLLLRNGFSGIDFVLPDYEAQSCHELSLMVSTAVADHDPPLLNRKTLIIIDPGSPLQVHVSSRICSQLESLGISDCAVLPIHAMPKTLSFEKISLVFLPELERTFLGNLGKSDLKWLQNLLSTAQYVLWVTHAEQTSPLSPMFDMVTGLARVLRSERSNFPFITLKFEDKHTNTDTWVERVVEILEATCLKPKNDPETEYRERDGMLWINRVVEAKDLSLYVHKKVSPQRNVQEFQKGPPLALKIATPGLIDSLQFREDPIVLMELKPNEIEIEVRAIGVNFRDVLSALGRASDGGDTIGCECAGTVARVGASCTKFQPGDRVCAVIIGCASSYARCDYQLAVKMPESLSFAEAAAIPITCVTAHYALVEIARLRKGESVLIHSGSGGTGQMAIQLAQLIGAEVYVTVGFLEKKKLIQQLYEIPEDHIFYSRDTSFYSGIMQMTASRGVDVVLNSLSGDSLVASWQLIAPFGRFIELGKVDIQANSKLPMLQFSKTVSFCALAVDDAVMRRPMMIQSSLSAMMDMIVNGTIKLAHPLHLYPISKAERAIRFMQSGKNSGKIVLTLDSSDLVNVSSLRCSISFLCWLDLY